MGAITGARAEGLAIGKLSQLTGVNIETIRYYEKIKVLPIPSRTENGRRQYGPTERRILAFVRRSRELGFSLDEYAPCCDSAAPKKPLAAKSGKLPRTISMTSAQRSVTSASSNAC